MITKKDIEIFRKDLQLLNEQIQRLDEIHKVVQTSIVEVSKNYTLETEVDPEEYDRRLVGLAILDSLGYNSKAICAMKEAAQAQARRVEGMITKMEEEAQEDEGAAASDTFHSLEDDGWKTPEAPGSHF